MKPRDFCYFLQGFFELTDTSGGLTQKQIEVIKEKLDSCFEHVNPDEDKTKTQSGSKPYPQASPFSHKMRC